jgi:hypothetical protein
MKKTCQSECVLTERKTEFFYLCPPLSYEEQLAVSFSSYTSCLFTNLHLDDPLTAGCRLAMHRGKPQNGFPLIQENRRCFVRSSQRLEIIPGGEGDFAKSVQLCFIVFKAAQI